MKPVLKGLTFAVLAVSFGLTMVPKAMAYDPLMGAELNPGLTSAGSVDVLSQPAVIDNSASVLTEPAVIDNSASVLTEPGVLGAGCGTCNTLVQPAVIDTGCNTCGGSYGSAMMPQFSSFYPPYGRHGLFGWRRGWW